VPTGWEQGGIPGPREHSTPVSSQCRHISNIGSGSIGRRVMK